MVTRRRAAVFAITVLVAGCGVPDQPRPDIVEQPGPPSATPRVEGGFPPATTTARSTPPTTTPAPPPSSSAASPPRPVPGPTP